MTSSSAGMEGYEFLLNVALFVALKRDAVVN